MIYVAALVLLFICKIRFPTNQPVSEVIRNRHGLATLQVFRSLEKISRKVVKKQCDLLFLKCCKSSDVFPKFLKFKLYRKTLTCSDLYRSWQTKLLNLEITSKEKELNNLELKQKNVGDRFGSLVSCLDSACLNSFVRRRSNVLKENVSNAHHKKLLQLGVNGKPSSCDPDKVIFNYSSVALSAREKFLLSFGLEFNLPVYKPNFFRYFVYFESLVQRLKPCNLLEKHTFEQVISSVKDIASAHFENFKSRNVFSPVFTKADLSLLKSLGGKSNLVICKPDKGTGVVLLDKVDYISKIHDILNDSSKFVKLCYTNIFALNTKLEDKVNRFIGKLLSLNVINDDYSKQLRATGSSPAILYGLPKIHKASVPLRPIMAAYNTATCNLAKFVVSLLSPFTTNEYTVANSYDFKESLSKLIVPSDYYLVSYDVKSLFTNVPLDETINICIDVAFQGLEVFSGMTKSVFKNLLSLCVKDGLFIFNNELFKQIDGVAMGSPLGPTFANIFLSFHERNWLRNCPDNFKPLFYRRYVDDTFVVFENKSQANKFFEYINVQHKNIKFTMDHEINGKLSFLDLLIEKCNGKLEFDIFRKPTFSGLGNSFFSYCSYTFKTNGIKTLLHRAYHLTSSYDRFHNEIIF